MKHLPKTVLVSDKPDEFVSAFEKAGVETHVASLSPSDNSTNRAPIANFVGELLTGGFDAVLLMTATGTRSLIEKATATTERTRFLNALQDCQLLVSGSSATTRILGQHGLTPALQTDQLPQWRTSLIWLEQKLDLSHQKIAVESTSQDLSLIHI